MQDFSQHDQSLFIAELKAANAGLQASNKELIEETNLLHVSFSISEKQSSNSEMK